MTNQELLKIYSAYLPYGVKVSKIHKLNYRCYIGGIDHMLTTKSNKYKLHLRPLSDLTKQIEHNGEKFFPYAELRLPLDLAMNMDYNNINNFPHKVITKMCEWHFDIFGLLDQNLAINLNEI